MAHVCSRTANWWPQQKWYNKRKLQVRKNLLWVRTVTSGQFWSEQQSHTALSTTALGKFWTGNNTTSKPVICQTWTTAHSLVLSFYRHLWLITEGWTLQLEKPLVHYCSPLFPAEGLEAAPAPLACQAHICFPGCQAGWKLLPLASRLRFPPGTATPAVWHSPLRQEFIVASWGLLQFHVLDKNLLSEE